MDLRYTLVNNDGILEVQGLPRGSYDVFFRLYDLLVSNQLFNKIAWGNRKENYTAFAQRALESDQEGYFLDVPCGPVTFTHRLYAQNKTRLVILSDLSERILRFAQRRIFRQNPQAKVMFFRANALNLPFADSSLQTVLSQGFLHIMEDPRPFLQEVSRVLKPSGMAFFTSLVNDRPISNLVMKILHAMGHIARPRNSQEVLDFFTGTELKIISHERIGGMLYIIARKRGS